MSDELQSNGNDDQQRASEHQLKKVGRESWKYRATLIGLDMTDEGTTCYKIGRPAAVLRRRLQGDYPTFGSRIEAMAWIDGVLKKEVVQASDEPKYDDLLASEVTAVRAAYVAVRSSLFDLGDALIELRDNLCEIAPSLDEKRTRRKLAELVGIGDLTEQRIGDYINTAEAFPPELRYEGISFRAYEDARKAAAKAIIPLNSEAVADIVKREKSGAKARKAIEAEPTAIAAVRFNDGSYVGGVRWDDTRGSVVQTAAALMLITGMELIIEKKGLLDDASKLEAVAEEARLMPDGMGKRVIKYIRRIVNGARWNDSLPKDQRQRLQRLLNAAERNEPFNADSSGDGEGQPLSVSANEDEEDAESI